MHREFDLIAGDGTRLRAWRNQTDEGPRVLVCNGMGVPPEAWPRLIDPGCEYAVAGWNHRGVLGSARPSDADRVQIEDHVDDAVALLDHLGWDDAVVVAWSLGVNVAFELARTHPERVAGLLSVAGVPGGTFDTILAPQLVPRQIRRPLGLSIAKAGRALGPQLNWLAKVVPTNRAFVEVFRHSGIMLPYAEVEDVTPWVKTFFHQDFEWYFHLAVALERHGRIDPSFIDVPVTIVAGAIDALTSHADVMEYAAKIPHAEVHSLPGSHCLPLEFPDRIMEMLRDLYVRAVWENGVRQSKRDSASPETPEGLGAPEPSVTATTDDGPMSGATIDLRDGSAAAEPASARKARTA